MNQDTHICGKAYNSGYRTHQRCAATGKIKYNSDTHAKHSMRKAGNRIRTYRCKECGCLHVTHYTGGK